MDKLVKGAIISDCKKYRYALWRIWDFTKPRILFIGLNPSIANADIDDPTVRRLIAYVSGWGFGGFYICNLFAHISKDPVILKSLSNPIEEYGSGNNLKYLKLYSEYSKKVVFIWGTGGKLNNRQKEIINLFPKAYCFGVNKDNTPKHPLYLKKDLTLITFNDK
jgi:hypothetical protein